MIGEVNWWEEIVGEAPEKRDERPRVGESHSTGTYAGGELVMSLSPVRIDWNWNKLLTDDVSDAIPVIGPLPEAIETFKNAMKKWIDYQIPTRRLAFGAVLIQPVENAVDGYKRIQEYVESVKLDIDHMSEFLYQINRSRPSTTAVADLVINRLTQWSIMEFRPISIHGVLGSTGDQSVTSFGDSHQAFRLGLDINTKPGNVDELPPDKMSDIFSELVEMGLEIAEKGDVA